MPQLSLLYNYSHIFTFHNIFYFLVPGLSASKGLAFALQANDPHTKDFTLAILHLHENYFLDDLKRKWWENANGCPQERETSKEIQIREPSESFRR